MSWLVSAVAIFALLGWDERRLDDARLARAWPVATRRVAVLVFGAICIPIHFWRTRRSARGLAMGVAWMILAAALDAGATFLVDLALGAA